MKEGFIYLGNMCKSLSVNNYSQINSVAFLFMNTKQTGEFESSDHRSAIGSSKQQLWNQGVGEESQKCWLFQEVISINKKHEFSSRMLPTFVILYPTHIPDHSKICFSIPGTFKFE